MTFVRATTERAANARQDVSKALDDFRTRMDAVDKKAKDFFKSIARICRDQYELPLEWNALPEIALRKDSELTGDQDILFKALFQYQFLVTRITDGIVNRLPKMESKAAIMLGKDASEMVDLCRQTIDAFDKRDEALNLSPEMKDALHLNTMRSILVDSLNAANEFSSALERARSASKAGRG